MHTNNEISDYIQKHPKQMEILEHLRHVVHEAVPGTTEAIKWGFPVFARGKDFAYLRAARNHVTLGFYHCDKIDDPDQKLEGSGNMLRHIKIRKKEDIDVHLITRWLKAISHR